MNTYNAPIYDNTNYLRQLSQQSHSSSSQQQQSNQAARSKSNSTKSSDDQRHKNDEHSTSGTATTVTSSSSSFTKGEPGHQPTSSTSSKPQSDSDNHGRQNSKQHRYKPYDRKDRDRANHNKQRQNDKPMNKIYSRNSSIHRTPNYNFESGLVDPNILPDWDKKTTLCAEMSDPSTTVASNSEASTQRPLTTYYNPQLLSTFSWNKSDRSENKGFPSRILNAIEYLNSIREKMIFPGSISVYKEPKLPLVLKEEVGHVDYVEKPPLISLLVAAARSSHHLLEEKTPTVTSAEPALELSNAESMIQKPPVATFVAFRNSLRAIGDRASKSNNWRVDVQRYNSCILLRRYLSYSQENRLDIGHQFEKACAESPDTIGEFRGVVRGRLGEFSILTSGEIDLVLPKGLSTTEIKTKKQKISIEQKEDSSNEAKRQPQAESQKSFFTLDRFIELKALKNFNLVKALDIWMQCFLGGVQWLYAGRKFEQRSRSTGTHFATINQIDAIPVETLIDDRFKETSFQRLHDIFRFVNDHTEEGKLYKLVNEKLFGEAKYSIRLYEIINGMETLPIVTPAIASEIHNPSSVSITAA